MSSERQALVEARQIERDLLRRFAWARRERRKAAGDYYRLRYNVSVGDRIVVKGRTARLVEFIVPINVDNRPWVVASKRLPFGWSEARRYSPQDWKTFEELEVGGQDEDGYYDDSRSGARVFSER